MTVRTDIVLYTEKRSKAGSRYIPFQVKVAVIIDLSIVADDTNRDRGLGGGVGGRSWEVLRCSRAGRGGRGRAGLGQQQHERLLRL